MRSHVVPVRSRSEVEPSTLVSSTPEPARIATYALCGFANLGSIGIQIGGLSPLAPHRRGDLARLGLRAMIVGSLSSASTACVIGMMI